jgi:hypothetical protein
VPDHDTPATPPQRAFLTGLQGQALQYFLDNQTEDGLVLDRQSNHGPPRSGWRSTSATGMGLVALALAPAEPYRMLATTEAVRRVRAALETALFRLPHDHGVMPHFLDDGGAAVGIDAFSTVDSGWLIAGGLWAAAFLGDTGLEELAGRLYDRVDWLYWTAPGLPGVRDLIRHGKDAAGRFFAGAWDRLAVEAVFLYVLGAGAAPGRVLPAASWAALRPFYGTVAGLRFNNADLGLFAFQYGLDLLDFRRLRPPGGVDLAGDARLATQANRLFCREAADRFVTYRRFWGLSDDDGPGDAPGTDAYRAYGPGLPMDGTAHLIATLAAVEDDPEGVLENLRRADDPTLRAHGRYGFSNVNLDRHWIGRDMVGIDAGAAVLAVDNYLADDRVRRVFHAVPCVARGLEHLHLTPQAVTGVTRDFHAGLPQERPSPGPGSDAAVPRQPGC